MRGTPLAASWRRSAAARPGRGPGVGESLLRFTLSQSAEADSNYNLDPESPGTSYFGDTRVGVDLVQETPTQRFALGLDTGLRALWEAGQDFEFTVASPTTASVGYGQEWSDAAFDADVRYRQRQVDYLDDLSFDTIFVDGEPVFVPDNLDQLDNDTIEQRYDANLGLELATNSPSSYSFSLQATQIDYTEDSEDLSPSGSLNGEALWRLRLNPVLSGALLANYYYYATEAGTQSTVNVAELDAGVIYEPSEELSFNVGLGYADRQRRETIDGVRQTTEDETGPVVRGAITYAVADELSLSANARVTTAAPDTRLSGALRASYTLPRGTLTARLSQGYTGDSDGQEVRVTTAGLGLSHAINSVSSLNFDASYGLQVNQDDPAAPDINRADFSAVYSRNITEARLRQPRLPVPLARRGRQRDLERRLRHAGTQLRDPLLTRGREGAQSPGLPRSASCPLNSLPSRRSGIVFRGEIP